MKTLKHDKIYDENNEIKESIVELSLDTKNNEIDNIIYYLICAQDKLNENSKQSHMLNLAQAMSRLDAAFYKLRDLRDNNFNLKI